MEAGRAWVKFAKIVSLQPDMEMVVIPVTTFARVIRRRPWVGSRNKSVSPIGEISKQKLFLCHLDDPSLSNHPSQPGKGHGVILIEEKS